MGPFDNEHTPLQLQGTGEMNIACFSSKRKRSIHEKDTVFPRGHCAGPDFEWVYVSRDRSGIAGKRSFKSAGQRCIAGWEVDNLRCLQAPLALSRPGCRLLDQNGEL